MSFVAIGLLGAGVAAAAIPMVIHLLLRRRTRPLEWAAMAILIEAARRHRSRSRIERILLLTIRTLAVLLLGAALAQPILGERITLVEPVTVQMVIDDGIMSGVRTGDGETALEKHVAEAVGIIESLSVSDRVSVTLASRPVRDLVGIPTTDHRSVLRAIEDIRPREGATDMSTAIGMVLAEDVPTGPRSIRILSDFRRGTLDDRFQPTSPGIDGDVVDLVLATPSEREVSSVRIESIDSVRAPLSLASEGDIVFVTITLFREGDLDPDSSTVRISGDAVSSESIREVEWTSGQQEARAEFRIRVDDDGGVLEAVIDGGDGLALDDRRYVVVDGRQARRVLLVGRGDLDGLDVVDRLSGIDWFERALVPDPRGRLRDAFDIDRIDPISIDDRDLEDASIIVIERPDLLEVGREGRIAEWVDRGGILVVLPPPNETVRPWASGLLEAMGLRWSVGLEPTILETPSRLDRRQPESEITRTIGPEIADLAASVSIERRLPVSGIDTGDVVLVDDLGEPVLVDVPIGSGRFIMFTVAPVLNWTDLPVRPLMVPLVQEIVRKSSAIANRNTAVDVGEGSPKSSVASVDSVRMPDGRVRSGSDVESIVPDRSGIVEFLDVSGRTVERRVVNPAVSSIDLRASAREEIMSWFSGSGEWRFPDSSTAGESDGRLGSNLATILIVIVLSLCILDLLLSRWFVRGGLVTSRSDGLTGANAEAEADRSRRIGADA